MTRAELFEFMRRHRYCVVSSVADDVPQSAVVGFAVSPELEIIFDTLRSSRKYRNLIANPSAAVAMWTGETTVQYEGVAAELSPADERYREIYFETWPDGRDRLNWPGLTHFVIRPKWARLSDFDARPPRIEDLTF
jgi:Pyridoxamine 5'-phosphate oxidase